MSAISETQNTMQPPAPFIGEQGVMLTPFSQEWVLITKQEQIDLKHQIAYWREQHTQVKHKFEALKAESLLKDALIKDLQNRCLARRARKAGHRI